jgi:hypothetical protein
MPASSNIPFAYVHYCHITGVRVALPWEFSKCKSGRRETTNLWFLIIIIIIIIIIIKFIPQIFRQHLL